MTSYKGHLVGGAVCYLVLMALAKYIGYDVSMRADWFVFMLVGSIFPDVDTNSMAQKIFAVVATVAAAYFLLVGELWGLIGMIPLLILPLIVKHRGIFHNIIFLTLFTSLIGSLVYFEFGLPGAAVFSNSIFFMIGVVTHLALDRRFF